MTLYLVNYHKVFRRGFKLYAKVVQYCTPIKIRGLFIFRKYFSYFKRQYLI